jgi:hypothetical protein
MSAYQQYSEFLRDNLGVVISLTGWLVVVLEALQVGLTTKILEGEVNFQRAAYGFVVFSIVTPILLFSCVFIIFIGVFFYNLVETIQYKNRLFAGMDEPRDVALGV